MKCGDPPTNNTPLNFIFHDEPCCFGKENNNIIDNCGKIR